MKTRVILSIVLNLAAVAVPMALLYVLFGSDTRVAAGGREAVDQLAALSGAMAICASLTLVAERYLRTLRSSIADALVLALRTLRSSEAREPTGRRRHA
jgi:hypothetical protein